MEILNNWISGINDLLWSYVLIIMLLGCAFRFTFKTRFVQFRMFREMIRVLGDSANKAHEGEKHISSFQAFAVSLASRVGTGNLAGVATAVAVGGPGAVFWMWIIALLGSASAFVESTLAQLYKRKGKESFIGGPAYYMRYGLGLNWMGILFAILISVTFGFAFNSVQSNTICAAMQGSFGFDPRIVGAVLTVLTLAIIFGGIQRIAKVSSVIVPVMALGYVALASGIVLFNITELPAVIKLIVSSAFRWEQAAGGTIGAALMQGIKRGLFSNEAGMGSAPNVAATASVTHPVKQGLIQTLGVFTDTLLICTCTAFIIILHFKAPFKAYRLWSGFRKFSWVHCREQLRLGLPMFVAIFCETSLFSIVGLLMSEFGTLYIAANQAAISYSTFVYTVPWSISLTATIVVGYEVGAKNKIKALQYDTICFFVSLSLLVLTALFTFTFLNDIAALFTHDKATLVTIRAFLIFALIFSACDAMGTPVQGMLRGYKDVRIITYVAFVTYWIIAVPMGYVLAHYTSFGPYGYWLSLVISLGLNALILNGRLWFYTSRRSL